MQVVGRALWTRTVASRQAESGSLFPSGNDLGVVPRLIDGSGQTPAASDQHSGPRALKGRPRMRMGKANGRVVWHPSI